MKLLNIISNKNKIAGTIEITEKTFLFILLAISFAIGTKTYVRSKPETAKNITDLKQIYPPILPQFHISVL